MKLKLKGYTEPLTIEVERPDGATATIEAVLDFSDRNLFAAKGDAKRVADAADRAGDDDCAALAEMGDLISSAIDRLAGEGTASAIVEAFGFDDAADCVSSLTDVWVGVNGKAAELAAARRAQSASRYLDANA